MDKEGKGQFVKEMNAELQDVQWAFLLDYRGLSVSQAGTLRSSIREANSKYRVVKNRLTKLAIKDTPIEPLSDQFSGPIAIAWTKEDPVALAKVLYDFSRKTKLLDFKSAIIAGQILDADKFKQFSRLPGRDELLTQLVYVISSPVRGFVTALNEINAGFVRVLAEIKNKKEKEN